MTDPQPSAPHWAYVRSVAIWMTLYVVLIAGIAWTTFGNGLLHGPLIYVVSALPALPIAMVMLAMLRLMQQSDEYVRALLTKRFVIATGLTFVCCAVWGFMESFAHAVHIPMWLVFPLFWACFGLVSPFVRTTR